MFRSQLTCLASPKPVRMETLGRVAPDLRPTVFTSVDIGLGFAPFLGPRPCALQPQNPSPALQGELLLLLNPQVRYRFPHESRPFEGTSSGASARHGTKLSTSLFQTGVAVPAVAKLVRDKTRVGLRWDWRMRLSSNALRSFQLR